MVQKSINIDKFWQKTIIKILPRWIKPNHLSLLRLILILPTVWLIGERHYPLAILLFAFVALTDSLDGALARTRNQITPLGLILDPISDKLLIVSALILLIFRYPFPELIFYPVLFELAVIIIAYVWVNILKRPTIPANSWGKLKMICQSLSVIAIMAWLMVGESLLLYASAIFLLLTTLFIILSALHPIKSKNSLQNQKSNV